MFEDLREQVIEEGAFEYEEEEKGPQFLQAILGLEPWQRLLLAVLLFLNVALCGCMGLVMIGRIMPPF